VGFVLVNTKDRRPAVFCVIHLKLVQNRSLARNNLPKVGMCCLLAWCFVTVEAMGVILS